MRLLEQAAGLRCDRVMVFPQGNFSIEAMKVLKVRNFHAAVNTAPQPVGQKTPLTLSDLAQPAVLRYGGFPLFARRYAEETRSQDIATDLFFGRPVLIVEHHDIFKHSGPLVEAVQRVNGVAPGISWTSLERAVDKSILRRRTAEGTVQVRAYSDNVRITNDTASVQRLSIAWNQLDQSSLFERVLRDGAAFPGIKVDDARIRVFEELSPGASKIFSVVYRNGYPTLEKLGFRQDAKAFLRRMLSEVRDNHLSKNQYLLTASKTLWRLFGKHLTRPQQGTNR